MNNLGMGGKEKDCEAAWGFWSSRRAGGSFVELLDKSCIAMSSLGTRQPDQDTDPKEKKISSDRDNRAQI